METKKFRDFYEYFDYLEINMNDDVKKLCKEYDVNFNHSGGGCIHLGMSLNEDYFLIGYSVTEVSAGNIKLGPPGIPIFFSPL